MQHINHEFKTTNMRQQEQPTTSTTSTTTTRTTDPGVFPLAMEDMERIALVYQECIGPLNAASARLIEWGLEQTLCSADDMIYAIKETALAPHPSAAYLRGILRRWIREGVDIDEDRNTYNNWWKVRKAKEDALHEEDLPW